MTKAAVKRSVISDLRPFLLESIRSMIGGTDEFYIFDELTDEAIIEIFVTEILGQLEAFITQQVDIHYRGSVVSGVAPPPPLPSPAVGKTRLQSIFGVSGAVSHVSVDTPNYHYDYRKR